MAAKLVTEAHFIPDLFLVATGAAGIGLWAWQKIRGRGRSPEEEGPPLHPGEKVRPEIGGEENKEGQRKIEMQG